MRIERESEQPRWCFGASGNRVQVAAGNLVFLSYNPDRKVIVDTQLTAMQMSSKAMILNPLIWPHMRLPMKRRGSDGFPELGFLMTGPREDGSVFFYKGSMFYKISDSEQVTYPTVDALLADGWIVD